MEKTDKDCARSHKDVREEGRVNFTEIAREQAILKMNSIIQPLIETHTGIRGALTLAISSLFLYSPLTSVTFPFSSNSVHRKHGSLRVFAVRVRPRLKRLPSAPSSMRLGAQSLFVASFERFRPSNLRNKGRFLVETCREDGWMEDRGGWQDEGNGNRRVLLLLTKGPMLEKRDASSCARQGAGLSRRQFELVCVKEPPIWPELEVKKHRYSD